MKKLFKLGNQYAKENDWKDFALVKICLCAMGIAIGALVSQRHRKTVTRIAAGVFIATYIPLITDLEPFYKSPFITLYRLHNPYL